MPKPNKGPRLGGGPAHERLLLANLATQLFEHERIQTTETKAKRLRPVAERLITFGKRGDLHARRQVMRQIGDRGVVHKLFTEIAPQMAEREGGYTRIIKTGYRKGDNAPMAVIELVLEPVVKRQRSTKPVVDQDEVSEDTEIVETESTEVTESEETATDNAEVEALDDVETEADPVEDQATDADLAEAAAEEADASEETK